MSHLQSTHADEDQAEILGLVSCRCPACRMVTWHSRPLNQEIFCPFCSEALPAYVTKLSPEKVVADDETRPSPTRRLTADYPRRRHLGSPDEGVGSPFVLEFFMVQGIGFQCMAYRNGDGKWHEAFNDRELPGVLRVLE
jgi:hypothetical protein